MASTMDFSRLDVRAALDLAIMIEEDAQLRYEALARLVGGDPGGAGEVFREMAVNERKHRADLEARRGALFQAEPRIEISLMEGGVERPDVDDHDLPRTAREALGIALAAEKRAHAFYLEALPGLSDGGARALFEDLALEEAEHVVRLERKLAALGAAPSPALCVTPRAALPAAALAFPDRSALEAVLPLFDAATQAVAVGVIVEGRDPGDVAASLGVSPRSVAWKLKRFLDLARQQLAVAMAAAALTGCAGAELPGNAADRAAQAWPQDARAAVIDQVTRAQAPQEPADVGARAEAAAAREASDLEFTEGLAEPPQGTVAPASRAWAPPADADERPTPIIEDVWPDKVPSTGGERVVIRGKYLEAAQVLFGLAPARILEARADQLTVVAPAGSAGEVAVVVTNRDGTFAVARGSFQFYM